MRAWIRCARGAIALIRTAESGAVDLRLHGARAVSETAGALAGGSLAQFYGKISRRAAEAMDQDEVLDADFGAPRDGR